MTSFEVISSAEFKVSEKINDFQSSTGNDFGSIMVFRNSGRGSSAFKVNTVFSCRNSRTGSILPMVKVGHLFSSICFSAEKLHALKFSPGK